MSSDFVSSQLAGDCVSRDSCRCRSLQWGMGPSPFGDGNVETNASDNGGVDTPLQWGHRLSAMETGREGCYYPDSGRLQWGHRLSAMETGRGRLLLPGLGPASMGPPPFGDGNRSPSRSTPSSQRSFNGATAFRRWKGSENIRGNRQHPYFNGAVAELQEMTYRGKHSRKGLEFGNNRKYPL